MLFLLPTLLAATPLKFDQVVARSAPVRFGVISGPTGGAIDLSQQYRDHGIRYVRNNDYFDDRLDIEGILDCGTDSYPSWSGCDANDDGNYRWEASDALMSTFATGGFEPMLRLGGEWQNRSRKHEFKGPQTAEHERNWIIAATRVATRYRYQYVYADIWTEFPGQQFWDREPTAFYPFWVRAYRSVKAAVPEARVGGPGFAMMTTKALLTGGRQQTAEPFLRTLYAEGVRPDWIGWHIFSSDPSEYAAAGKAYRRLLDGTGEFSGTPWAGTGFFSGVELVLDAFGYGRKSNGKDLSAEVTDELMSGARGAAATAASLVALSETDTTRAYYYRGNDPGTGGGRAEGGKQTDDDPNSSPRDRFKRGGGEGKVGKGGKGGMSGKAGGGLGGKQGSGGWLGLFDRDGTAKPVANAVALWVRMADEFPDVVAVSDPGAPGTWALSARGPAGWGVFLVNYSDVAAEVSLANLPGQKAGKTAEVRYVDETNDGSTTSVVSTGALRLAPWQVAMALIPAARP